MAVGQLIEVFGGLIVSLRDRGIIGAKFDHFAFDFHRFYN